MKGSITVTMNHKLFRSPRLRIAALLFLSVALCAGCAMNGGEALRLLLPTPVAADGSTPAATVPSAGVPAPAGSAIDFQPDGVTLATEIVVEGLQTPVFVTHAGDGSGDLYVLEKAGTIRIVRAGELLADPFLDISERVTTAGNEQGLLGLAFAPDYVESGYFFVNYSATNDDTVIARFQRVADSAPPRADPTGEFVVLQLAQPARNHNGGMLAFGPDGYLYIGMGDGGASGDRYGNGQNPDTLLGKMLRLDVTSDPTQPYTIPADNPWVGVDWNGQDVRDEIWAVGLRNPWRYSFDRATGDLWIGDVGQNQYEEIHFAAAASDGGQNYGWPIMEASHCYASSDCDVTGLTLPVAEYSHTGHCSVTGGYVYRGAAFPTLAGVYFYGDYCSGTIWATWPTGDVWQTAELFDSGVQLSSFGEDEAGELYLTDMSGGRLLRLVSE